MSSPARTAAVAGVLALTGVALYFAVFRRVAATVGARRGAEATSRVMARFTPDYVRPSAAREALAILEPIRNGSPDDQRTAMLRGSNLLVLNQPEAAEEAYREALSWGERPEIYVALANAQAAAGKREAAIGSLGRALAFDPYLLIRAEAADLRDEAIRRYAATATPAQRAEMYLNIAIGYLNDGFRRQSIEMLVLGASHDPRILQRSEIVSRYDGTVAREASLRYAQIHRERGGG